MAPGGSILRSHLIACVAGLLLASVFFPVALGVGLPIILLFVSWLGWPVLIVVFMLAFAIGRRTAIFLGADDRLIFISGMIALAAAFSASYVESMETFLRASGRFVGTMLSSFPSPYDPGSQAINLLCYAAWIGVPLALAVRTKRRAEIMPLTVGERLQACSPDARRHGGTIWIHGLMISALTILLLGLALARREAWSSPEQVYARSLATLRDPNASDGDRVLAMDRLRGSRVPETTALLRKLARSGSEVVQVHAALALIGRDDIAALQILEPLLERGSIAPAQALPVTSRTPAEGGGVHIVSIAYSGPQFLGSSIASVRDPAAVPALVRLMRAPDAVTRAGAASALRAIMHLYQLGGTWVPAWPDSVNVPAIIDTVADGLDDADEKVRYFSVCTLMEISGNPHYPSVPLFQSDESTYLATWKKWARERPLAQ